MAEPPPGVVPLRVLIVEDEWIARNYLMKLLNGSGLAQVIGAVPDVEQAREALGTAPAGVAIDVVFVDIQLAGEANTEAGIELVRELATTPEPPMCVLATASQHHALHAFDLGVLDYLVKPFSEERVQKCLRRLHERRKTSPPAAPVAPRIVARRRKRLVFLRPDEVWAFEAADRLTFVHTRYGKFDIDLSLSAIESSFGRALLRAHRNWLVNSDYVREIERDDSETALLVGEGIGDEQPRVRVPVARERVPSVRDLLLANATGLRRS